MAKKNKQDKKPIIPQIVNKRAKFDYHLEEEIVAGMVLNGREVRAARDGHVQLKGAFATIRGGELWLNNASFSINLNERGKANQKTVDTEPKKLLVSRKQLNNLIEQKQQGFTIVPIKMLTGGKFIKLVISLGKGKKKFDKRETIKRRDIERDAKRILKFR